jgi:putative DNA primase/helicase
MNPSPKVAPLDLVLSRLPQARKNGSGWMVRCPAHDDNNPSLKIDEAPDGKVLLRCFAGCSAEAICRAVGLEMVDLWPKAPTPTILHINGHSKSAGKVTAIYRYHDEAGGGLFEVLRKDNKDFPQRHQGPDGKWVYNLEGVRRVLYRLPELLASPPEMPVFIVEGEKDVERLTAEGLVATCNPGGAGKWRSEYNSALEGRNVVLLPDNDDVGQRHARAVAASLAGTAHRIKLVQLAGLPPKGDVSDWLDAGHTPEELINLARATPDVEHMPEAPEPGEDKPAHKFRCMADVEPEEIDWLWEGFLARGKFGLWEGDPGVGKTFALLAVGAAITRGWALPGMDIPTEPGNVMLLTLEDDLADTIRPRLDKLGADVSRFFAFDGMLQFDEAGITDLRVEMARIEPKLLIIDPIMAYIPGKVDIYKPNQVRTITNPLGQLGKDFDCAVAGIRHLTKSQKERAIYRGAGGIDFVGASRLVVLIGMDPDNDGQRAIVRTKGNLGAAPQSVNFSLDAEGTFLWAGSTQVSPERLLAAPAGEDAKTAIDEAVDFLKVCLTPYPRKTTEVYREAKQNSISEPTLRAAKRALGVSASRHGVEGVRGGGVWLWSLPGSGIKVGD